MPGLRSLIARRRCSLPSQSVIKSQKVSSYSVITSTVSSNKKRNRPTCDLSPINHYSNNCIENTFCTLSESKWNLHTLYENDEQILPDTFQAEDSANVQCESKNIKENSAHEDKSFDLIDEIYDERFSFMSVAASGIENENKSMTRSLESHPNATSLISCTKDGSSTKNELSSDRIIIKMKLLHGNSLSDIIPISSKFSEDIGEATDDAFLSKTSVKSNVTRWMIDSILKEPVLTSVKDNNYKDASGNVFGLLDKSVPVPTNLNEVIDCSHEIEKITMFCYSGNLEKPLNNYKLNEKLCKTFKERQFNHEHSCNTNKISFADNKENNQCDYELTTVAVVHGSSDISEDSLSSGISEKSCMSSLSNSCIKSCSIVIRRIDESNNYSCLQSPKSKKKKIYDRPSENENIIGLDSVCKNNGDYKLFDYEDSSYKYTEKTDLPCSVILCDIFSNFLNSDMYCPFCLHLYNLENCLSVDIYNNKLTLQCSKCEWIIIRRLLPKDINVLPKS